jgi:hypothetical protein
MPIFRTHTFDAKAREHVRQRSASPPVNVHRTKGFPTDGKMDASLVRGLGNANALAISALVEAGRGPLEVEFDAFDIVVAVHIGTAAGGDPADIIAPAGRAGVGIDDGGAGRGQERSNCKEFHRRGGER